MAMNVTFLRLTELTEAQLEALARLHLAVMPGLLTDFGLPFVRRYYQAACREASVISVVALAENGSLSGWALGSPNPARLNAHIRQFILREALRRPQILPQLFFGVFFALLHQFRLPPGGVELTYLGVAPAARGQGMGAALLREFLAAAENAPVELSVETDNAAALALYRRFDFVITRTYREGFYRRHRMRNE
ncbi:MAG: hypothetical protein CO094_04885 [Anaerolineae bacterium CG_4_9_14_3_um_filter_57_17]|nr:MAG: hypothetical protein CO094_04885 [Anaerolineae bacterium CG_4_9_14_3_um_filter_57_17]